MSDLPSPSQITDLASLLAPGLIISAIRTRAITGLVPEFRDRLVAYFLISTGYFAAVSPLFHVRSGVAIPSWLWSFLQYFVVPMALGILAAYFYQIRGSYRIAAMARLHLAHHLPASWDYVFEGLSDTSYLLVTLKDGTQIAGKWATGSFASSSRDERDLLIADMYSIDEDRAWKPLIPARSILICGGDIEYIEIFGR